MQVSLLKRKKLLTAFLPFLLGIIAFFIVVGPRALNPTNIAWLGEGDPVTHYLGWVFFRNSDWSFPIGLNPRYGLELASSILYSDSNPLFAILFKPFAILLPETFQYFGLWLLACFVLQAWFGWKLIGLLSEHIVIRLLGASLFVFSPPMIARLHGHFSLVGHFLIVAALYFAFHPKLEKRLLAWGVLLATSALVHAYLLAMVTFLWLADLIGRSPLDERSIGSRLGEFLGLATVVGLVCWQVGYFSVGSGVMGSDYGFYRMNLLSVFDSSGWSYVLKDIPEAGGDYEGFNYLGLGVLVLALWSLPTLINGRIGLRATLRKNAVLLIAFVGLTLFALSNNIGIGSYSVELLLPEVLLRAAKVFQSSGRMFWPVFYALIFALVFFVARRFHKRTAIYLLSMALLIQVADTSAGWKGLRKKLMVQRSAQWESALKDPFWEEAAQRYRKVRWVFPENHSPHWSSLAAYAGKYGLSTDAIYLARVGETAFATAHNIASNTLKTGNYEPDALYILNENALHQAVLSLNFRENLLAKIDGLNVLAPGWINCDECRHPNDKIRPSDLSSPTKQGFPHSE